MSSPNERELTRLQAVVNELPTYLQSGALFSNVIMDNVPGGRENYSVSVSGALALIQDLQNASGLSVEQKSLLDSLNTRLQSLKRFYPDAWKDKLNRELHSRSDALKWNAEEAARERREDNVTDKSQPSRLAQMRNVLQAARDDVDTTPYQNALDKAESDDNKD